MISSTLLHGRHHADDRVFAIFKKVLACVLFAQMSCLVSYSPVRFDVSNCTVTLSAFSALATDSDGVVATLTARQASGSPLAGIPVKINAEACSSQSASTVTDAQGMLRILIRSGVVTSCTVNALLLIDVEAVPLPPTPAISFTAVDALAGVPATVVVPVGGSVYTGTAHFSSSDSAASLPADYTFTAADRNSATFSNVIFRTSGVQTLRAVDVTTGKILFSATYLVTASNVETAISITATAEAVAGVAIPVTFSALDASGHVQADYAGTLSIASSEPNAQIPSTVTLDNTVRGTTTIPVVFVHAGTWTLLATDQINNVISNAVEITVSPAQAAGFWLATQPAGTQTAGVPFALQVTPIDAYGNAVTNYAGIVSLTTTSSGATLPGAETFTPGSPQLFTGLSIFRAGSVTLTASDTARTALQSGTTLTVTHAAAASVGIVVNANAVQVNKLFRMTLTALDAFGNTDLAYTGTLAFSASDTAAVLPNDVTFTPNDDGVLSGVEMAFETPGAQELIATDLANPGILGNVNVTVLTAVPSHLVLSGLPVTMATWTDASAVVTARDVNNNVVAHYTGTIHFTSTDSKAVLPADYAFADSDGGVHAFTGILIQTPGNQSIQVFDQANNIASNAVALNANYPMARYTISTITSGVPAGITSLIQVDVMDANANFIPGYRGTVHFTSTDPRATLPADYAFTANDAGMHMFPATLAFTTPGTQTLTAEDSNDSALVGTADVYVNAPLSATFIVASRANPEQCLDLTGANPAYGTSVSLHPCQGFADEVFTFGSDGTIKCGVGCLTAGALSQDATISSEACALAETQRWIVSSSEIKVMGNPNLCLDANASRPINQLTLQPCANTATQGVVFHAVSPRYTLEHAGPNNCAQLNLSVDQVLSAPCSGSFQQTFSYTGSTLISSNICVTVANSNFVPGQSVNVSSCIGSQAQNWKFDYNNGQGVVIKSSGNPNFCLDSIDSNKTSYQIQTCSGSISQTFYPRVAAMYYQVKPTVAGSQTQCMTPQTVPIEAGVQLSVSACTHSAAQAATIWGLPSHAIAFNYGPLNANAWYLSAPSLANGQSVTFESTGGVLPVLVSHGNAGDTQLQVSTYYLDAFAGNTGQVVGLESGGSLVNPNVQLVPISFVLNPNADSTLCVEVANGWATSNAPLQVNTCTGAGRQSLLFSNIFESIAFGPLCVDVPNGISPGSPLQLRTCGNGGKQSWAISADAVSVQSLADPNYCIAATSLALLSPMVVNRCDGSATQRFAINY